MVLRFDAIPLTGAVRRTDAGAVILPAAVARTGVQEYRTPNGRVVREYRPESEVFAPETLASLAAAPVTIGHPRSERVDATTIRGDSHGVALGATGRETIDGEDYIIADVAIQSAEAVGRVDRRELVEVSAGYRCDTVDEPGMTPGGLSYDRIQRNIRFNHVALLAAGRARAGSNARLRLDSADNQVEGKPMPVKFRGESFDVATPEGVAALQIKIDAADVETAKTTAERDVAVADLATAKTRIDAYETADRARAREALETSARAHLPKDFAFAGKSDRDIRLAVIGAVKPTLVIRADAADAYVDAAYDLAIAEKPAEQYRGDSNPGDGTDRRARMAAHTAELDKHFTGGRK